MSNFGHMRDLRIAGLPIGPWLEPRYRHLHKRAAGYGSIIGVFATDAPLSSHQLGRISKRVALGIGRAGSIAAHGSGEMVLAFSTANKIPRTTQKMIYHMKIMLDQRLNPLYEAAIEATEEAILNSLCMAREMEGVNGNFAPALPLDEVREIVRSTLKPRTRPPTKEAPGPPPEAPRVSEAPPTAAPGAEGMMTVPPPKEAGPGPECP